ncbi:hypothetical protein CDH05_21425 [Pseudomonas lactis]|nr:hypothetical protein CDH05_21425 [Pseudomonas lactis]
MASIKATSISTRTSTTDPLVYPVGASLLAKNSQTPRLFRKHALSLTFFASKLAPTPGQYPFTSACCSPPATPALHKRPA